MSAKKPNISAFFPCYNDAKSIGQLIDDAILTLKQVANKFEVIVINDGSTDESQKILLEKKRQYTNVLRIISHKHNRGYGGALKSGFRYAKYDLVFYTDGDGQYDVKELAILLHLMTPDVNFVNGLKMERQDFVYRVIIGNFYALIMRWLFQLPIYDVDCDFRLIRKSLLQKLNLKSDSGSICVELIKKADLAGAKFRMVSVHHYPRKFGQSQFFHLGRLLSTFREILLVWWNIYGKGGI